jgi:hypothetical protein
MLCRKIIKKTDLRFGGWTMAMLEEASVRAVGVCWYEGKILFQSSQDSSKCVLPGARVGGGKKSKQALKLSIQKLLGAKVDVGSVLYVIENTFSSNGKERQELGIYYEFQFTPEFGAFYEKVSFSSIDTHTRFEWIDESELKSRSIVPPLIKDLLIEPPLHMQFLTEGE